jgi:anti-sigma regulatory factor (Ser/Thr protein kinase)
MSPRIRQSGPSLGHVVWPTQVPPGTDFKPQYVCSLVFVVVRVAGIIGSSLSVPTGTRSLLQTEPRIALVFAALIAVYLVAGVGLARGYFASFVGPLWVVAADFASVAVVNVWASGVAPARQLDSGGNDLFWMAAIGSISLWGAVRGRVVATVMMSAGAALLIGMSLANGFAWDNLNWAFVLSRLVFAAIGVIATTSGLRISERFEELRRLQGQRAGEQQALGAMHRRALQDLKVISRLASEEGLPEVRLQEIKKHATGLAEYVRTWPEQHKDPLDIDDAIRTAVAAVDPLGATTVETAQPSQQAEIDIPAGVLAAVQEAVGEAVSNALQHAAPDLADETNNRTTVTATIDKRRLLIDISDNGCGFETVMDAGDSVSPIEPHVGLGLSRIVEVMESVGGTAILTSAPGMGSTWTLSVDVDVDVDQANELADGDDRLVS